MPYADPNGQMQDPRLMQANARMRRAAVGIPQPPMPPQGGPQPMLPNEGGQVPPMGDWNQPQPPSFAGNDGMRPGFGAAPPRMMGGMGDVGGGAEQLRGAGGGPGGGRPSFGMGMPAYGQATGQAAFEGLLGQMGGNIQPNTGQYGKIDAVSGGMPPAGINFAATQGQGGPTMAQGGIMAQRGGAQTKRRRKPGTGGGV